MNHFELQARALVRTARLAALFVLALAGILASLYLVTAVIASWVEVGRWFVEVTWWRPGLFVAVVCGGSLVIAVGTLAGLSRFCEGSRIAAAVGGRQIDPATADPLERRLVNVVEIVAIASGLPVPAIFLLDRQQGLNAFVAGYGPADAALGVTRGCLEALGREELEGVIAHELSHVLNGDMRVSSRMIALLQGILTFSTLGSLLLYGSLVYREGNRRDREGAVALQAMGIALVAVGALGVLVGRVLKAAISRERELLADVSAVQLTRNPGALRKALERIAGLRAGSRVDDATVESASHAFFAHPLGTSFFGRLLASHPPIEERLRRLEPGEEPPARVEAPAGLEPIVDLVGRADARHLAVAHDWLEAIPAPLVALAHQPAGAKAVIYGLLLADEREALARQLEHLGRREDAAVLEALTAQRAALRGLPRELRLPLVDLAAPALRHLAVQRRHVVTVMRELTEENGRTTLFDFALVTVVAGRLAAAAGLSTRVDVGSLDYLMAELSLLVSALAWAGHDTPAETEAAFGHAVARLPPTNRAWAKLRPAPECTQPALGAALGLLARTAPQVRAQILDACARAVHFDRKVTPPEADLLRAVAIALECPLPPFVLAPPPAPPLAEAG